MSAIEETTNVTLPKPRRPAAGDSPSTTERVVIAAVGAVIAFLPLALGKVFESAFRDAFGPASYSPTYMVVVLGVTAAVCVLGVKGTLDLLSSVKFGVTMLV